MEYVKDRTENFDDYYPYIKKEEEEEEDCNPSHVYQWMVLFLFMYNTVTKITYQI